MSEPNPYEAPREPEPTTTRKAVKRTVGVVVILALTPLAGFVTFFVSCVVALSTTNPIVIPAPPPGTPRPSIAVFWLMTLVPTSIVVIAMLALTFRLLRRQQMEHNRAQQSQRID